MAVITQFRNNFLFDSFEDYNCSFNNIDWSARGIPRPVFGTLCIIFCGIGIVPYVACTPTLWRLRQHACYKMMFILSFADIFTLIGLVMGGIVFYYGGMYCHAPRLSYFIGLLTCGSFFASCCSCFMIAINRFVELFDITMLLNLYKGNRPWLLMIIPVLYGYVPMMISPYASANSEAHLFLIDPLIFDDGRYEYTSYFLLYNNFTMPTISSLLYLSMICVMFGRRKTLSIQCSIIVVFHMTTLLAYAVLQLIHTSDALQYVAHMSWILMHGIPPYVYFLFNSAIRKSVLGIAIPSLASQPSTTMKLSNGNRPWYLMIIPALYGIIAMICTPFTQANSEAHIFMLDPMIHNGKYDMTSSDSANRAAIMLSIKCGVIVVFHATTCLGYVCLQIYPTDLLCYAMQLSWIIMHGVPPFVYVTLNPAIRKSLKQIAVPSQSMFVSTSIKMTGTSSIHNLVNSSIARIETSAF
ncbi:hypothetical protein PRIPAC_82244 [Pristionchus pacificus]|uniref:G protein-coupled receptor n=1 Tax=Pristionchus pacificus TaxID=54126 RepID=A0A2A6CNP0_PRIPA|nr:hypothetical protein PRIPAC_82244 [Pristionchus pacificus]|eukprot:PDM79708.1 G protein-coupled receptor [Pristionchus pacificus]